MDEGPEGVVIPWEELSPEALRGVIGEFVTREGTDYGHVEADLEAKMAEVRGQLERGEAVVLWDARSETVNVVLRRDLPA